VAVGLGEGAAAGGHHGDGQVRRLLLQPAVERPAVHARHPEVEQHEVRASPGDVLQRLVAIGGQLDVVALVGEHQAEHLADIGVVVDDQHRPRALVRRLRERRRDSIGSEGGRGCSHTDS